MRKGRGVTGAYLAQYDKAGSVAQAQNEGIQGDCTILLIATEEEEERCAEKSLHLCMWWSVIRCTVVHTCGGQGPTTGSQAKNNKCCNGSDEKGRE